MESHIKQLDAIGNQLMTAFNDAVNCVIAYTHIIAMTKSP